MKEFTFEINSVEDFEKRKESFNHLFSRKVKQFRYTIMENSASHSVILSSQLLGNGTVKLDIKHIISSEIRIAFSKRPIQFYIQFGFSYPIKCNFQQINPGWQICIQIILNNTMVIEFTFFIKRKLIFTSKMGIIMHKKIDKDIDLQILQLLSQHSYLRSELVKHFNLPRTTIYDHLKHLMDDNKIEPLKLRSGKIGRPLIYWKLKQ